MMRTRRLRQFRPAAISRAANTASAARNAMSITAASSAPQIAEPATATRPASQSAARAANGKPLTGKRPVQLGMAVSRKPVTMAVEHLVDMPVERREGGWQRQLTKIVRQPQQDAECSP